jgi:hypothetical protein
MVRRLAAAAMVAVAAAALRGQPLSLLDLRSEEEGPHRRFTDALASVRDLFANVSSNLSAIETLGDADEAASQQHVVPAALNELAGGIDTLRRVRTDVAASSNTVLPAPVRMQVIWDIDRCAPPLARHARSQCTSRARFATEHGHTRRAPRRPPVF